jgi:hypothetical protein
MTSRLSRHARDLQLLADASPIVRRRIISQAPNDLLLALVDAAKRLLKGDVSLTPLQLGAVRRHKKNFRKVIAPRTTPRQLRKVYQTGGFLPALLGPILKVGLPLLNGILGGLSGTTTPRR